MNAYDIIIHDREKVDWGDVLMDESGRKVIDQLIKEYRHLEDLKKYNLPVNNKLLLHGSSGCGKTMTAKAIANSLGKMIYILNLSNFISARIGETSQNLKLVFDKAAREGAVLFLDEFDQIGKMRGSTDQDVGEMRRLVNTLIQLIDYFPEKALLVAATNHLDILDHALIRRFQCIVEYEMPAAEVLDRYYDKLLSAFPTHLQDIERKYEISFAEAKDHIYTLVKARIIDELESGTNSLT